MSRHGFKECGHHCYICLVATTRTKARPKFCRYVGNTRAPVNPNAVDRQRSEVTLQRRCVMCREHVMPRTTDEQLKVAVRNREFGDLDWMLMDAETVTVIASAVNQLPGVHHRCVVIDLQDHKHSPGDDADEQADGEPSHSLVHRCATAMVSFRPGYARRPSTECRRPTTFGTAARFIRRLYLHGILIPLCIISGQGPQEYIGHVHCPRQ